MTSDAQKRASKKYQKDKYKMLTVKLDKVKDSDIICHLCNLQDKMEYIRSLIRKDMGGHEND